MSQKNSFLLSFFFKDYYFFFFYGNFPGSPVVETLPSSARGASLIPGQGAEISRFMAKIKIKNRSNIITN